MRKWFSMLRFSAAAWRRLGAVLLLTAVGVGAFCWGRHAATPVEAQQPAFNPSQSQTPFRVAATPDGDPSEYNRRVVAEIYGNIPITREELGEYLIARFGAERLEFLVNRKIVEMACQAKGIVISNAEVDAQIKEDLKAFGPHMTMNDFTNQVLKRFNKSLYEWKEDVIRPKLAMKKLVEPTITVTPEEVQQAFEARYGPKVQCRMIVLQKDHPQRTQIWEKVSQSEEAFREQARSQFIPELAARGGEVPPVHRHFPDPKIEKEAFSLKVGQVSSLMQVQDGTWVILKCDKHLPKDPSKRVEEERLELSKEVSERKLAMRIPEVFNEMRQQAQPRLYMTPPNQQNTAHAQQQPIQAPTGAREAAPNPTVPAAPTAPAVSIDPRPTPPSGN